MTDTMILFLGGLPTLAGCFMLWTILRNEQQPDGRQQAGREGGSLRVDSGSSSPGSFLVISTLAKLVLGL